MQSMLLLLLGLVGCANSAFDGNLKVCAFNIQIFGVSKMEKAIATTTLPKLITRCHLVAVQEVRDATDTAVDALLDLINSEQPAGEEYAVIESERFGSSSSKESYAWFHRADMMTGSLAESWAGDATFPERSPHSVTWTTTLKGHDSLTFEAIVMHMDPDAVVEELKSLGSIVTTKMAAAPATKNLIVMGDFNADCGYLPDYKKKCMRGEPTNRDDCADYLNELWSPGTLEWLIDDDVDTTTSNTNCAYDRFIVSTAMNARVVEGSAAPYKYDAALGLSTDDAKIVSDHYPIEMTIKMDEVIPSPGTATGNATVGDGGGGTSGDGAGGKSGDANNKTGTPCNTFYCAPTNGNGDGSDASSHSSIVVASGLAAVVGIVVGIMPL